MLSLTGAWWAWAGTRLGKTSNTRQVTPARKAAFAIVCEECRRESVVGVLEPWVCSADPLHDPVRVVFAPQEAQC